MNASDLKINSYYRAKVSGKETTVRLDRIEEKKDNASYSVTYHLTNMASNRRTTFRSASQFISACDYAGKPLPDGPRKSSAICGCGHPSFQHQGYKGRCHEILCCCGAFREVDTTAAS